MPWQIIAIASFGLGFYFAIYILDIYYHKAMKNIIDEIHKCYLIGLKKRERNE